jgi:hypothetical protein
LELFVHRILSDLTPLLDGPLWHRTVLGGDLNVSTQTDKGQRYRAATVFERLESLGLVDLPRREQAGACRADGLLV